MKKKYNMHALQYVLDKKKTVQNEKNITCMHFSMF